MIILGLDALDLAMVRKYHCKNLMQLEYGKTDISEFKLARTVVLWASFITGKNMEDKIPVKTQWEYKLKEEGTFFHLCENYKAIDVPAFSLKEANHKKERELLKAYFENNNEDIIENYDKVVWRNHEENKKDFYSILDHFDLVMGYFDLADAIGHLSFGIQNKMKDIYQELDKIANEVKSSHDDFTLIVSDHGMHLLGRYGDHSKNGFYSTNRKIKFALPKITDFYQVVKSTVQKK